MAQLMTVTVGALATADPDGVSLSQTAAGAQYLVINGALAGTTFDADSICASQTPGGAGALTINGALAQTNNPAGAGGTYQTAPSAYVQFPTPQRVYITCAGNNSGRTFTVTGTLQSVATFGPGAVVSETVTGANTNVVATTALFSTVTSVTISGASTGAVTVGHSGTATMDKARRVAIDSASDDSDITFTITGTDLNNKPISETMAGGSSTVATSLLSYLTVISILTSAATSGSLTVGSSAIADSQWLYFDRLAGEAPISIQIDGSGTVNWTVSQTLNDITIPQPGSSLPTQVFVWTPDTVKWVNHPDTALVGSAVITGVQGHYDYTPAMARVTLNSGTGSIRGTFIQSYMD